jgi:hypothetical protein
VEKTETTNNIKAVRLRHRSTDKNEFYYTIQKFAMGSNKNSVMENIDLMQYNSTIENNTLYIQPHISLSNKIPYNLQNVLITVYVPYNKTLIISRELKNQMRKKFVFDNRNIRYSSERHQLSDEIYTGNNSTDSDDEDVEIDKIIFDNQQNKIEKATEKLNSKKEKHLRKIEEKENALREAKERAEQEIKDAEEKLQQTLTDTL